MGIEDPFPKSLDRATGGAITPGELAVHTVLHEWFLALADGTVQHRHPDPGYVRPHGKPMWTEGDLAQLVSAIDGYVRLQMGWANRYTLKQPHDGGPAYTDGPGYDRLTLEQRLAFAQELELALEAHPEPVPYYGAPVPPYTSTPGEVDWAV